MSSDYQRKWRRRRARVDALAEKDSSSESEGTVEPAFVGEENPVMEDPTLDELHAVAGCSSSIVTATEYMSSDDEEYHYDISSSDTECEQLDETSQPIVETPSLHNDLASWATATNQTHKAINAQKAWPYPPPKMLEPF